MFRKWFWKMSRRAWDDHTNGKYAEVANEVKSRDYSIPLHKAEMSPATDLNTDSAHTTVFRIVNAIGGSIIETRRYDPKTERNSTNLYIVNDGEDLTESLGKVMTMEALR